MNYFAPQTAAERYAHGRPFFHPLIVRFIKEFISLSEVLPRALDVGCGTGLSTVALTGIARDLFGVDASSEMLAHAPIHPRIRYVEASAECLPFGANEFDIITVSQAFHWLDRDRFFTEAARVTRAGGWLVVYDNYFVGCMTEGDDFHVWFRDSYLIKYPSPQRPWADINGEDAQRRGFRLLGHEMHQNTISFTHESLVDYLLTQSNIIAKVEGGQEELRVVRHWLLDELRFFFEGGVAAEFIFNAPIWYLQLI